MHNPSHKKFIDIISDKMGSSGVVPVYREVLADLDTPVSAFMRVCGDSDDHAFLLESVEGGERWARYSFIGLDPEMIISATGNKCTVTSNGETVRELECEDPLSILEEELGKIEPVEIPGLPRFSGGGVGWIGWDAVRWWEHLPTRHEQKADGSPTLLWMVPRSLLIFDNLRHRIQVVRLVFTEGVSSPELAWQNACDEIEELISTLKSPLRSSKSKGIPAGQITSNFSKEAFESAVETCKEAIFAGDCIQVVISQRFKLNYKGAPLDLYRALRAVNPSPYMFFLKYPEQLVIGASPEVMVRVTEKEATVAPIAGTRHRGATASEDEELAVELLADPKERAEHVMLVDLARNDLGRVAKIGTVEVKELMEVQRFSHVMHIVSDVRCELGDGMNSYDAIRATFPAGTLSGAPKVRAMEIIDELEPHSRGLYGGAVGWIGFDGDADLAIAIRTTWQEDGQWVLQVGAGIVADSDPSAEHQETLNKAGGLLRALEVAGRGL